MEWKKLLSPMRSRGVVSKAAGGGSDLDVYKRQHGNQPGE